MTKRTDQTQDSPQNGDGIPFSAIIDLAHEAIIVIDDKQVIILINRGAEQVFGYAASEVIGKPLDILLPPALADLHRAHVEKFSRAPESAHYMHQRQAITGRRKDGSIFPAEASIVKVSDGERNIYTAILRDVAYRKDAESWQAVIEQAGDIVFITDRAGVIEYVNPSFEHVTGYTKADALGKTPRILKSGLMSADYYRQTWETILAGEVAHTEALNRKKNGELFYYDQTISPLKDLLGRVTHFISTGKDVTLRKRAEQELQLMLKLTQAIAEAESFDSALSATLKLVCETMNWDFGEVWIPSRYGTHLELGAPYYSKFDDVESFRNISSQFEFKPGVGLPGRVWESGHAAWVSDVTVDANFPRAAYAREAGLKSAIGIPVLFKTAVGTPIMAGSAVVTVLEFFMRETRPEDERMMQLSAAISAQLGAAFQHKRTEEALKQNEARLREAQRIAKMGNWELDLLTNQLIWSDEIFRIFEIDKEKFGASYEDFLNLIHPQDRELVDQVYTNSLKTRQPYEITHRLLMPDGRVKYVEERCENFYDANSVPVRSVGTIQDITERRQAEESLRASEERYRLVLENSMDAILLTALDGSVISANSAACAMFQRTEEDIRQLGRGGLVDVTDSRLPALLAERARAGKATGELTMIRSDGSRFPADVSSVVFKDSSGAVNTSMIIRDITERKRAEEALRASEEQYRTILQTAMDGYWLSDTQGRLLDVNEGYCQMSGYDKQELLGMSILDLEAMEDAPATAAHIHKVINSGEDRFESIHRRKDGSVFNVEISVQYKPMNGGRFVSFLRDVTERKRVEDALRESEAKWKSLFSILPVGVSILNEQRIITDMNPALERILDITKESLTDEFYKQRTYLHPNNREISPEDFPSARAIKEQRAIYDVEIGVVKNEKGNPIIWTNVSAAPLPGGSCVIVTTDITEHKQAEDELRRWAKTFEHAEWGIIISSADGKIMELMNPAFARMHGYTIDELKGQSPLIVFAPEARADLPVNINLANEKGHHIWESTHLRKDGSRFTVLMDVTVVRDDRGGVLYRVINVQDITERKRAEEALRASEERFKTIFNESPLGIALIDSLTGRFEAVNPMHAKIMGRSMEEMVNLDWMTTTYPDDVQADLDNMALMLSGQISGYKMEKRHVRPDGSIFWINLTVAPLNVKDKNHPMHLAAMEDITERKQADQETAKLRNAVEQSADIIFISNRDDTIEYVNPAFESTTGYNKEEAIGKTPRIISSGLMSKEYYQKVWTTILAGEVFRAEVMDKKKNGEIFHYDQTITPIKDTRGNITHFVSTGKDVTERKRAEEALRESEVKFRTMADFTYDWEAWRAPGGAYLYVSPSCERITGRAVAEFMVDADLVLKIAHPQDLPLIYQHRHDVANREKQTLEFDFRIVTPTGETRWVGHSCTPVYGANGEFLGRRESNRDITERKQAELELRDSQQHLREIVDAAPFGAHMYRLDENDRLIFMDANESANQILEVDNSIFMGRAFEEVFPPFAETELSRKCRLVAKQGGRHDISQLVYQDERLSVLLEIHIIQIAPRRIAVFFRNISELAKAYDETIIGWSRAMDFRDKETEDHTQRVTSMTVELARVMGFDETDLSYIRWGALLHDIGKIGIPDNILRKPGGLTEDEQALMRKHPDFAYDMLHPIRFLRPALDIPYCHHEKWDGTGYPRGLKGKQIPLSARIFTLVDVWDALRSDRPYRKKWTRNKVVEHIRALTGTHFDPALVDIFLDFVNSNKNKS